MKVIVAGSRSFTQIPDEEIDTMILRSGFMITEVVCGCAKGIDMAGEYWAGLNSIPVKHFHPDWNLYGNAAGPIRNAKMAAYSDALILIWDGSSRGSQNMKNLMKNANKPVYEIILKV